MLFLSLVPGWAAGVWGGRQDGEGRQELQMTNALLPSCHPASLRPKISPSPQATNKISLEN